MSENIYRQVTIRGTVYKIINESYEDDYGSLRTNYQTYSKPIDGNVWKQLSPAHFCLSPWEAEAYIPKEVHECPTCKHITYTTIYNDC